MPTDLPTTPPPEAAPDVMPDADLAMDETRRLIASNKVEGTHVYNLAEEHLGSVYNFMVDKFTGQAIYAVISFGGFLGVGERYFPVPWERLTYDTRLEGYVVDIDRDALDRAPSYAGDESPWGDPAYGRGVNDFYKGPWQR
jgi:hypothetical protein